MIIWMLKRRTAREWQKQLCYLCRIKTFERHLSAALETLCCSKYSSGYISANWVTMKPYSWDFSSIRKQWVHLNCKTHNPECLCWQFKPIIVLTVSRGNNMNEKWERRRKANIKRWYGTGWSRERERPQLNRRMMCIQKNKCIQQCLIVSSPVNVGFQQEFSWKELFRMHSLRSFPFRSLVKTFDLWIELKNYSWNGTFPLAWSILCFIQEIYYKMLANETRCVHEILLPNRSEEFAKSISLPFPLTESSAQVYHKCVSNEWIWKHSLSWAQFNGVISVVSRGEVSVALSVNFTNQNLGLSHQPTAENVDVAITVI